LTAVGADGVPDFEDSVQLENTIETTTADKVRRSFLIMESSWFVKMKGDR